MKDTALIYFSRDQGLSLENLSPGGGGKPPWLPLLGAPVLVSK